MGKLASSVNPEILASHLTEFAPYAKIIRYTDGLYRDANQFNFCGIIPIFKADFCIAISNVNITANNRYKMVPDKIMGVTPTSTLVTPYHRL